MGLTRWLDWLAWSILGLLGVGMLSLLILGLVLDAGVLGTLLIIGAFSLVCWAFARITR